MVRDTKDENSGGSIIMLQDTGNLYLPQDAYCYECGRRIGDHKDNDWWRCLEKLSSSMRRIKQEVVNRH